LPSARAKKSSAAPGEDAVMMRMGLTGKTVNAAGCCARHGAAARKAAAAHNVVRWTPVDRNCWTKAAIIFHLKG
jgi:hypothetical protein